MKAALFANPLWLNRESTTLRRLVVGLVGEQVRVWQVVPTEAAGVVESGGLTAQVVTYTDSSWRAVRNHRLRRLAATLRPLDLDVLHAMDGSMHEPVKALGASLNVPVVCSCWSRAAVERARHGGDGPVVITAPTPALVELLRSRLGGSAAAMLLRPGVYGADEDVAAPLQKPRESLSCLVIGDGRADAHYQSLMDGMAQVRDRLTQALYFLYAARGDPHRLWQAANRLDLLNQVTMVPHQSGTRQLLVQADVVIVPQPLGVVRSLVLEAMAAARPVIACRDAMLDYLIDQRTAVLLDQPAPADWARVLLHLVAEPAAYQDLGRSARQYVREHHSASAFIEQVLAAYRKVAPQPLPFSA